jgi:hypothetical protein
MDRSRGRRDPWRSAKLAGHTILLSCSSLRLLAAAIGAEPEAGRIKGRAGINRRQRVADKNARASVLMLRLCTAYPQDSKNGSRSHREPALLQPPWSTPCVTVSQRTTAFISQSEQFRLHTHAIPPQSPRPGNSRGPYETFAGVEAKKTTNRNDEAEGAQTEIHRSFANEGAKPEDPHRCLSAASRLACEPIHRRLRFLTDRRPVPRLQEARESGMCWLHGVSVGPRRGTGLRNL